MRNATTSPRSKLEHAFRHALFLRLWTRSCVIRDVFPRTAEPPPARMKSRSCGTSATDKTTVSDRRPLSPGRKSGLRPTHDASTVSGRSVTARAPEQKLTGLYHVRLDRRELSVTQTRICGPTQESPPGNYLCTVSQWPEIDGSTSSTSCPSATSVLIVFFPSFTTGFFLPPAKGSVTRPCPSTSTSVTFSSAKDGAKTIRDTGCSLNEYLTPSIVRRTRGRRTTRAFRRRPCGTPSKSCRRKSLHGR